MARLRAVTKRSLTDVSYKSRDIPVKEGEQYGVATRLFNEDTKGEILFFYYWSDEDLANKGFYTYPIEREDCEIFQKLTALARF